MKLIVSVNNDQTICLNYLNTTTGDVNLISTNLCSIYGMTCDANGYITALTITSKTTYVLKWDDLNCLTYLNSFTSKSLQVDGNLLYSIPSNIKTLSLTGSNITSINGVISEVNSLSLNSLPVANLNINVTHLSNVTTFSTNAIVNLVNDNFLNQPIKLTYFTFFCNSIPDISSLPNLQTVSLTLTGQFDESSFDNLSSFKNLKYLTISSNLLNAIGFPSQFSSMVDPNLVSLYFIDTNFNAPLEPIDLSNFKKPNFMFYFNNAGINFNINGKIPITVSSSGNVNTVYFYQANISSVPDLSLFSNITTFSIPKCQVKGELPKFNTLNPPQIKIINLQQNKLTGTVDPSWCEYKGVNNLDVSFNSMIGALPNCIQCYLGKTDIYQRFRNNNFDNFFANATCDYSQITLRIKPIIDGKIYTLFGKNIGYDYYDIVTNPESSVNYVGKNNYTIYFDEPITLKSIEVSIVAPKLNFTLSTSNTAPIINSVTQNNNTFTIDGSFFDYDYAVVSVKIGDNIICTPIPPTTFYQIICTIDYPIVEYGNQMVSVNVDGKLSNLKQINLQYTPVPCLLPNCNGHGKCNDHIGVCECYRPWLTIGNKTCLIQNHYVSSTSKVPLSQGGTLSLYGYFNDQHDNLEISIQYHSTISTVLNITLVTDQLIQVTINSSTIGGSKKLTVIQNGVTWSGLIYPYTDPIILCPNNCGGELSGTCNTLTGQCTCKSSQFIGLDCQAAPPLIEESQLPKSMLSINKLLATASISNEQTSFSLSFVAIVELDFNGNQVSKFPLSWNSDDYINNNNIYTFSKLVNNATVILTIEEVIGNDKEFNFAGSSFIVPDGGIKISLSISGWDYESNLNTIQIQMSSDIGVLNNVKANECNGNDNDNAVIESSSNSNSIANNVNYLKVIKNNKVLFGRFQDKLLSDGKSTTALTNIISTDEKSVLIGLNLPHCVVCLLDPDFSVLVSSDFKNTNSCNKSSSRKWVLPVAIVVSVCGAALIATIAFVLIKKHSVKVRVGLRNVSLRSLKDRSLK